jgi:hypothetical protein
LRKVDQIFPILCHLVQDPSGFNGVFAPVFRIKALLQEQVPLIGAGIAAAAAGHEKKGGPDQDREPP